MKSKDENKNKRYVIIAISAIIIFSFLLKIYHLDQKQEGTDESWSVFHSKAFATADIFKYAFSENQPPLFHIFGAILTTISSSMTFLRVVMVLISLVGIVFFYQLSRIFFNEKWSIFATFLYSINPMQVLYSQHFRFYGILMALYPLSVKLFYDVLIKKRSEYAKYLLIVNSMLLLTHYYALFFIGAQYAFYKIYTWRKEKDPSLHRYHKMIIISVLIDVILIAVQFYHKFYIGGSKGTWGPVLRSVQELLYPMYKFSTMLNISAARELGIMANSIVVALVLLLFACGTYAMWKEEKEKFYFLSCLFFGIFIIPAIIGVITSFYSFRYFSFLVPAFMIFVVYGFKPLRFTVIKITVFVAITVLWLYLISVYQQQFVTPHWAVYFGI